MSMGLIVGVMGGGAASDENAEMAYRLGGLIAEEGWILLNGGRRAGVMDASAKGAFEKGGMTVGVLPDTDYERASKYIKIPILTGMGSARNAINVLSSHIVVACPGSAGTISEIALALVHGRKVITMNFDTGTIFSRFEKGGLLFSVTTPEKVIAKIKELIM